MDWFEDFENVDQVKVINDFVESLYRERKLKEKYYMFYKGYIQTDGSDWLGITNLLCSYVVKCQTENIWGDVNTLGFNSPVDVASMFYLGSLEDVEDKMKHYKLSSVDKNVIHKLIDIVKSNISKEIFGE